MSPRKSEPAPGPTATTRLANDLRGRVLRGELAPGQPLREEDLAASTGLSRHTVRAALARLADERLVVAEAYRGMRVTTFAPDDVVALQQLRGALESEAVRLLREEHGDRWPWEVTAPIETTIRAIGALRGRRAADWPTVAAAHAAVHTALVAAAGSPRITAAYTRLHSEILLLLVQIRPAYSVASLVTEHTAYLAAVQRHGEAAVREHLAHSTALLADAQADPADELVSPNPP